MSHRPSPGSQEWRHPHQQQQQQQQPAVPRPFIIGAISSTGSRLPPPTDGHPPTLAPYNGQYEPPIQHQAPQPYNPRQYEPPMISDWRPHEPQSHHYPPPQQPQYETMPFVQPGGRGGPFIPPPTMGTSAGPSFLPPPTLGRHPAPQQQPWSHSSRDDGRRQAQPPSQRRGMNFDHCRPQPFEPWASPASPRYDDDSRLERDQRHSRRSSRSPEMRGPARNGWSGQSHSGGGGASSYSAYSNRPHENLQNGTYHRESRGGNSAAVTGNWRQPGQEPYKPPLRARSPPVPSKRRTQPREAYLATSLAAPSRIDLSSSSSSDSPTIALSAEATADKKLILLDLNGSLVFRANKQQADSYRRRPFVGNFIEYLRRRFEVGVWSSAQPHSVAKMVQSIGLRTEEAEVALRSAEAPVEGPKTATTGAAALDDKALIIKILWARDTFGLSPTEYNSRTETIKDLDRIWQHLNTISPSPPRPRPYDALNTLLLDDSYTKTSCQPFNHLPVPDFGQSIATDSAKAYRAALALALEGGDEAGLEPELRADLGRFVIDQSLLGIIGILERARGEANVAAWIRAGGLVPDLDDQAGWWLNEAEANVVIDDGRSSAESQAVSGDVDLPKRPVVKKSKLRKTLAIDDLKELIFQRVPTAGPVTTLADIQSPRPPPPPPYQPTPAELSPTAQPPVPWYASPMHARFWTERGVAVLEQLGIPLEFGMAVDFLPPTQAELEALRQKRERREQQRKQEVAVRSEEMGQ